MSKKRSSKKYQPVEPWDEMLAHIFAATFTLIRMSQGDKATAHTLRLMIRTLRGAKS